MGVVSAFLLAAGMQSAAAAQPEDPTVALQTALECRAVTDDGARLRCYDQAVGRLSEVASSGRLIIADPRSYDAPAPRNVDSRVRRAREAGYNNWVLELEDGSLWRTAEDSTRQRLPQVGERVRIERAMLGNYWVQIEERRRLRVRRILD